MVGASGPATAALLGAKPGYTEPPEGWRDTLAKTGEPDGIDKGFGYQPARTVVDTVRALAGKLDKLPPQPSIDLIQSWLKAEAFAHWYDNPSGAWPLVRLPDADAQALGAADGVRVANMSGETAVKQKDAHGELTAADYAQAQQVIDHNTAKTQDGQSLIYIRELPGNDLAGGYVLVVKATRTGKALWITSYRRLHEKEAVRDSEIRRLLKKEKK